MRLNRRQLRKLINEESKTINSQRLDESGFGDAERWLTTALGHGGIGDIAAGVKAITFDGGRLIYKLNGLYNVLDPFGKFSMMMGDSVEFDELIANLEMTQVADKLKVKESFIDFADMLKTFLVSVISAFPDGVISGPVAAAISAIPIERFFLEGTRIYADFIEKIESIPGGSGITWLTELASKASQGPLGIFFTDPLTVMKNLGRLMEAASSEPIVKDMISFGQDMSNLDITDITAELVSESRWLKIAGIL